MWFHEALFYHIYPLGLLGCPKENQYQEPVSRIKGLYPWIDHIQETGFNALYIGPLFESVGHGYETTDYRKLDSRLGTNQDLKEFVTYCHSKNINVIFDGVFNHTGRDFFAFRDLKEKREGSAYKDWFRGVNFYGNNEYNDGFSYENWGGYNLLVKLNHDNPGVRNYILDCVRFWIKEFDIDGLRLDAADVLSFLFMKDLRRMTKEIKPDFWLMGEVIHGDYTRWVNNEMLDSVTDYSLHKALYSGMNTGNFFEIAHTVKRTRDMGLSYLYNFCDNHDVERIYTKLNNKMHFIPVNIMLYTLPGIPSVYYGSEFGIEGKKERGSDYSLRPSLNLDDFKENSFHAFFKRLGEIKNNSKILSYGSYKELVLRNRVFVYERVLDNQQIIIAVSNDDKDNMIEINNPYHQKYTGVLTGDVIYNTNGKLMINVKSGLGDIYVAEGYDNREFVLPEIKKEKKKEEEHKEIEIPDKPYEEMTIDELHQAIINKMAKNGPVTDYMKKTVYENNHQPSLVGWVKSFR